MSNNQRDDHHYDSRQMVPQSARSKSSSNSSTHKGFTFDPMKNMHLWTMWRIGNTEKIVNFTKHRESEVYLQNELQHGIFSGVPYGSPTLLVPPLASNINVTEATKRRATEMMHSNEGDSVLKAGQFIYFGLPRVALKNDEKPSDDIHLKLKRRCRLKICFDFTSKAPLTFQMQMVILFSLAALF